jgi:hypothetical protein
MKLTEGSPIYEHFAEQNKIQIDQIVIIYILMTGLIVIGVAECDGSDTVIVTIRIKAIVMIQWRGSRDFTLLVFMARISGPAASLGVGTLNSACKHFVASLIRVEILL